MRDEANTVATPSEAYLGRLARASFLTLWSYPNLYTDESRSGSGDGKEFCDLTVVFGDRVLLFSDKHIKFSSDKPISVAWPRWYRRAIESSAKQLIGAESWLRRFPEKLFLDRKCASQFPLSIPLGSDSKVHKIVIANGAAEAIKANLKKDIPSLLVNTDDISKQNEYPAFTALQPYKSRGYVHIYDETTLDLILSELDTITEFIAYLDERERIASLPGVTISAIGEEQLLGIYMRTVIGKTHRLLPPIGFDLVMIPDGEWQRYISSQEYVSRRQADQISYVWDRLIESFTAHIISGRSQSPLIGGGNLPSVAEQEKALRQMASEIRVRRRQLGKWMLEGAQIAAPLPRFSRTAVFEDAPVRGYVLFFIKPLDSMSYGEYRNVRMHLLHAHVLACKLRFPKVTQIVGITSEGYTTPAAGTEDSMFFMCADWIEQDEIDAKIRVLELGIGDDPKLIVPTKGSDREFPLPPGTNE